MARLPRLVVPGQAHHLIQRAHAGQAVFREADDCRQALAYLSEAARVTNVSIHAYVLMPDHLHLLATPGAADGLSLLMQSFGRRYVRYFNNRHKHAGGLWESRYKATVIDSEHYLFTCMAFVESNPVRTGLVAEADEFPWSSCRHNVGGQPDPLVREHPLLWALGNTPFAREAAYRQIVHAGVSARDQAQIVEATLKGWALAPAQSRLLAQPLPRRAHPLPRGRPRKNVPGPI
jgi:putative transposase